MKKLLWILTICMMTLLMASVVVSAEDEYTGWTFDETTGTLTINTEYWMPDFVKTGTDSEGVPIYDTPWKNFKDSITTIVFTEDRYHNSSVNIGNGAFCGLCNLTEVKFIDYTGNAARLELGNIGVEAFYKDGNLTSFMHMDDYGMSGNYLDAYGESSGTEKIGARAFSGCTGLCFAETHLSPMTYSTTPQYYVEIGPEAFFDVYMGDLYIGGFFNNYPEATESFTGMHCNSINESFYPEGDHNPAYFYSVQYDGEIWALQEMIEGPGDPDPTHEYGTIPWTPTFVECLYDPDDSCDYNGHNKQYTSGTPATCTTSGTSDQCQCTVCGKTLEYSETVPALGHDWSDWVVTREPTTTLEGEETRTCSRCGVTETRPIDKLLVVVAKIGNTEYHSLQAAVQAASNGDVIVIQVDLEENITIPQGKDITIDLNGHKIHNVGAIDTITNEGDLLVVDGAEDVVGFIENDEDNCVPIRNNNILELKSGTIVATGEGSAVINNGTLSITGAVLSSNSEDRATIVNRKNATMTFSSGTITNDDNYGEAVANAGDMTMSGGVLDGVVSNSGSATLDISGGEVTGVINSNNPDNVTITGGVFGSDVSAYVDDDQASVPDNGHFVIKDRITVTVQSMLENSHEQVANCTGGGIYIEGDTITVTAQTVSGYEFKGWHEKDGDSYKSNVISDSISYTFLADKSKYLVAVYGVSSQGGSAVLRVNGAGYKVNGGVTQRLYNYSQRFDLNTEITLLATDPDFLYWMNSSDKIVTTDPEYTFTLVRDTTLTAVYKNADENTAFVEFVSYYDQIMQAQNYDANSDIIMPVGPSRSGFVFTNWDKTADEIRSLISSGVRYITVRPEYEPLNDTFSLKVVCDGTVTDERQLAGHTEYRVNPVDISGKKFSHWEDENGQWLSTRESYIYHLSRNTILNAIYVNESDTVEQIPVIAMTDVKARTEGNKNTIEYIVIRDVPEGYSVIKHGEIYGTNSRFGAEGGSDLLVLGADGVTDKTSTKLQNQGYYIYTANIPSSYFNTHLYVKGYMVVRNNQTGEITYYYTPMESRTFNELR